MEEGILFADKHGASSPVHSFPAAAMPTPGKNTAPDPIKIRFVPDMFRKDDTYPRGGCLVGAVGKDSKASETDKRRGQFFFPLDTPRGKRITPRCPYVAQEFEGTPPPWIPSGLVLRDHRLDQLIATIFRILGRQPKIGTGFMGDSTMMGLAKPIKSWLKAICDNPGAPIVIEDETQWHAKNGADMDTLCKYGLSLGFGRSNIVVIKVQINPMEVWASGTDDNELSEEALEGCGEDVSYIMTRVRNCSPQATFVVIGVNPIWSRLTTPNPRVAETDPYGIEFCKRADKVLRDICSRWFQAYFVSAVEASGSLRQDGTMDHSKSIVQDFRFYRGCHMTQPVKLLVAREVAMTIMTAVKEAVERGIWTDTPCDFRVGALTQTQREWARLKNEFALARDRKLAESVALIRAKQKGGN